MNDELYYIPTSEFHELSLEQYAACLRLNVLYMIQQAGHGHIGSAFSSIDILVYLHNEVMEPGDIFFSSKGHDCAALYALLISNGIIPEAELHNFRQTGGMPGHPDIKYPGISTNTGSLGMGLSKAQGMAIAKKRRGEKGRIFVLLGDGELQEGQNIEALRNIRQRELDNIVPIIDGNGYQCNDEIIPYYNRKKLFEALGYYYAGIYGGHDFGSIKAAFVDENVITHAVIDFETSKGLYRQAANKHHAGALKQKEYQSAIEWVKTKIPATVKKLRTFKKKRERLEVANSLLVGYNSTLCEIIKAGEERLLIFDADLYADCGIKQIKKEYPDRFYQFGISEQDMVSAAGGAALTGFIPIVHSFAAFLCRRANEQIYNNCTEGTKIIYVGALAGVLPSGPGVSHECVNDVEIMNEMPGLMIYRTYTVRDVEIAFKDAIYKQEGPSYIRIPCLPTRDRMIRRERV